MWSETRGLTRWACTPCEGDEQACVWPEAEAPRLRGCPASVLPRFLSAPLPKNKKQPDLTQISGAALWPHGCGQKHHVALAVACTGQTLAPRVFSPNSPFLPAPSCVPWKDSRSFLLTRTGEGPV